MGVHAEKVSLFQDEDALDGLESGCLPYFSRRLVGDADAVIRNTRGFIKSGVD